MDFTFTPEEEVFRREVRDFLKKELPHKYERKVLHGGESEEEWEFSKQFTRKIGQKGWIATLWPKKYGGLEGTEMQYLIFNEEMAYARAPRMDQGGSGIVGPGIISVTSGTSGVVFAHADRYAAEAQGRLHVFCHAVPGAWHAMGVMLSAGGAFRWFRDALGQPEKAVAAATGEDPYEILAREAATAPAGAEGLLFLPYLTGERTPYPDPNLRGAFVGLTLRHGKAHMVRSVLEGVSFGLRDSLELIKELGVPITQVRASGGGARSALWRQIQADVFNTELVLINVTEGAAFGAALLAGVGAGRFGNVRQAVESAVRVVSHTAPQPAAATTYETLYKSYRGLHGALKPTFDALAAE